MLDAADEAAEDADDAADEAAADEAADELDDVGLDDVDDAVDDADDAVDESAEDVSPSSPQAANTKQVQSIASASSRIVNFFMINHLSPRSRREFFCLEKRLERGTQCPPL